MKISFFIFIFNILFWIYIFIEPNQSTQAAGSGASFTFIITGLIAILVGVLTGGSIELMWSLANTLQIWVYFGMLNLCYSADLTEMYSYLKCANFENPISDYINSKVATYLKFVINPVNDKFSNLGFKSTEIISNSLDKLFMILIMLLWLAVLYILRMLVRNKTNKFANFIKQKDIDFRYEGITRFFAEFILVISISNFINLTYGGFGDVFESVSYVLSVVILTLTLSLIIYFYAYPTIYYESIWVYPDKNERHCLLFLEFRRDNVRNLLFYGNFAVHRVAFAFVVVWMKDFPINQWFWITLLSLWILWKTFWVYRHALPNFLNTFNAIVLLFYSILLFLFISSANPKRTVIVGYVSLTSLEIQSNFNSWLYAIGKN